MAIYKGVAYTSFDSGTGVRTFSVALDATKDPAVLSDNPTWEKDAAATAHSLRWSTATTGLTPPSNPDTVYVYLYEGNTGTIRWAVQFAPFSGSSTWAINNLYLTSDGTSTGTPIIGDYRLYMRCERTSVGTYDVNSDTQSKSGIIRVNPTAMTVQAWHTGVADPASWGDDIEVNIDLAEGYVSNLAHRQFDVQARNATTDALYKTQRTSGTDPKNALIRVDDVFPAVEVSANIDVVTVALPSAIAPDSEPDAAWIVIPATTADRVDAKRVRKGPIPVNASVIVDHHLQLNDNVIAVAKDVVPKQRLTADLGFVGFRLLNARREGLNGITATETLRDQNNLVAAAINRSVTTATVNGEVGWSPTLATWDSSLPGGVWMHEVAITSATADTAEVEAVEQFSLLSINPSLTLIIGLGIAAAANQDRHLVPGETMLVGVAVFDSVSRQLVTADSTPVPTVMIGRFNVTIGAAQYLNSDMTWVTLAEPNDAYAWPLTQSAGDPRVWIKQVDTSGFGHFSVFGVGKMNVGGTPYQSFASVEVLGSTNQHDGYKIDPVAFALHGVLGNR